MKKEYKTPSMEIMKVQQHQLLAGSISGGGGGIHVGSGKDIGGDDNRARLLDEWDDWE